MWAYVVEHGGIRALATVADRMLVEERSSCPTEQTVRWRQPWIYVAAAALVVGLLVLLAVAVAGGVLRTARLVAFAKRHSVEASWVVREDYGTGLRQSLTEPKARS